MIKNKSAKDITYQALAARAMHDLELRELMRSINIDPRGDQLLIIERLNQLDRHQEAMLFSNIEALDAKTGRDSTMYLKVNEISERMWREAFNNQQLNAITAEVNRDLDAAKKALKNNNLTEFEKINEKIKAASSNISNKMQQTRKSVRKSVRNFLNTYDPNLPDDLRQSITNAASDMNNTPSHSIEKIFSAPVELEKLKVELERERDIHRSIDFEENFSMRP